MARPGYPSRAMSVSEARPPTRPHRLKRGRKPKHYQASWGEVINGLCRRADGRWRVIDTGQTFVQPDERLAIHLYRTQYRRGAELVEVPVLRSRQAKTNEEVNAILGPRVSSTWADERGDWVATRSAHPDAIWSWVREQILTCPSHVAAMTGIPEIGYLTALARPQASATLDAIGKLYLDKAEISPHERRKAKTFWQEFVEATGVATVREVTAAKAADYRDWVVARDKSATYVKHRFGKVKTILHFARKRGVTPVEDVRSAIDACAVLTPPRSISLDPHPIDPAHFSKLLSKADEQGTAILLVMLNCCMYGKEAADLTWGDVDLERRTLVADRGKTGVSRVSMLWPRTVEALRKLPRTHRSLFITVEGRPHNSNTIGKLFRSLRKAAEVPAAVKCCDVRDGAYTEAVQGGWEMARVLAGQRSGMSDHYVKRRPRIVASCCDAIERVYFPAPADKAGGTPALDQLVQRTSSSG